MSIHIKEIYTRKELKDFVKFPMELYKENPYYVPPLIEDELDTLDKNVNPVFYHAEARYFLAYKNNKIVGRVAALLNKKEAEIGEMKQRFGWFDMIEDIEVANALLETVEKVAKENQLNRIEGPVGFSNMDKAGMLVYGFDKIATMITLYNHEYYSNFMEKLGFSTASEWVEYEMASPVLGDKVIKMIDIVKQRYNLEVVPFSHKKEMMPYADQMFELLSETYGKLSSYVPLSQQQIEYYKQRYLKFLDPKFVICIKDSVTDKLMAFAISMPAYSKALQKANGKLLPFGWYHLWKATKENDSAAFYLIGIHPKLQGKGAIAIVFSEMSNAFKERGILKLETNPELADNVGVQLLWKDFDPTNHKRRRSYYKTI
jgi:hypothetical protein